MCSLLVFLQEWADRCYFGPEELCRGAQQATEVRCFLTYVDPETCKHPYTHYAILHICTATATLQISLCNCPCGWFAVVYLLKMNSWCCIVTDSVFSFHHFKLNCKVPPSFRSNLLPLCLSAMQLIGTGFTRTSRFPWEVQLQTHWGGIVLLSL